MTDDIVTRLREDEGNNWWLLSDEAADEIERLRAEIARKDAALQKAWPLLPSLGQAHWDVLVALAPAQEVCND